MSIKNTFSNKNIFLAMKIKLNLKIKVIVMINFLRKKNKMIVLICLGMIE